MKDKTNITVIDPIVLDSFENIPIVEAKTAVILPDGLAGFLHPSGTITNEKGHFITNHQRGVAKPFDRDSARMANKKRESMRSAAVQAAIISGTGARDIGEGVSVLSVALVKIITSPKSQNRDKILAFKELMRFGGLAYDLGRGSGPGGPVSGGQGLTSEAIHALNVLLPAINNRLNQDE